MSAALAALKGAAISSAKTASPPMILHFMIVPRDEHFPIPCAIFASPQVAR
jgi:hypothetical protein